jgi:hypothetical protein
MTRNLTARKHVHAPPRQNVVPTEFHSDGQLARYFPRTLRTLLSSLGYCEPPLFVETPRLLHGNTYLWHVHVVIYERSTTDRICHIHKVIEASTLSWTFEGAIRDAAHKVLAILRYDEDDQTEHSQYRHFLSQAQEGVEDVVLPMEGRDHISCFVDQVKLTRAMVRDLDEAIKEVKLLGEHGEEASQNITELEALCKKLREDAQKLREVKTKLEGMVKSHDELIMEFTDKYGYNRNDEDTDDEDEDDDNRGDTAAPPTTVPPTAAPEVIIINEEDPVEMVPEQEFPEAYDVNLADAEPEPSQPWIYTMLMRDCEQSPSRMMDDLHELDDPSEADYDVDEWYPEDGSNDQD